MAANDVVLRYTLEDGEPIIYRLRQSRAVVGSSSRADVRIDSPYMSRQHFLIEVQDDRVYITDLGSSNGTMLQGRQLIPNQRYEWQPGDALSVANIRFDVDAPQFLGAVPPAAVFPGEFNLIADPPSIRAGQTSQLILSYTGTTRQTVFFRSDTQTDGLQVQIDPPQSEIVPGQVVNATVHVTKHKPYWTGGTFSVALVALTNTGLDTIAELLVRVRPRYELLLLLLLLIPAGVIGAAAAFPALLAPPEPTATFTPSATFTLTPSPTLLPTDTPEATDEATEEPTDTPIPTATPFPTSTMIPTREPTQTPIVVTRQVIIVIPPPPPPLPPVFGPSPTPVTPGPGLSCNGMRFTSTSGLPRTGNFTFYWDPPTTGGVVTYYFTVTNLDSGRSQSLPLPGITTQATMDVGPGAMGEGFRFTWQVRAELTNRQICTASDSGFREAEPCNGAGYNPCGGDVRYSVTEEPRSPQSQDTQGF